MALNKDGLEIGKPVDFETLQRVLRKRKDDGGSKATRSKEEVHRPDEQRVQDSSRPASKKKAKKGG